MFYIDNFNHRPAYNNRVILLLCRYVVSVGWDKHINIYPDDADGSIHHIQHPLPKWPDDEMVSIIMNSVIAWWTKSYYDELSYIKMNSVISQ